MNIDALVDECFAGHQNEEGLVFFDRAELTALLKRCAALAVQCEAEEKPRPHELSAAEWKEIMEDPNA